MLPAKRISLIFVLVAFFFFLLSGVSVSCTKARPRPEISLSNLQPLPEVNSPSQRPLGIAVAGVLAPSTTLVKYQKIADYLGKKLGRPTELLLRPTYAEINDLVRTGAAGIAFVCDGAYVEGQRQFGMELMAAPQIDGQTVYYSYIIVPADSPAHSLIELKDMTFAFSDPLSTTGRLAPSYALREISAAPETFFKKYIFTYSHENSIRAVSGRLVDGAAVDSLVYEDMAEAEPSFLKSTRIIERLGPYGIPPVVVSPSLDGETKLKLKLALITADGDERGREALKMLGVDRFVALEDSAYDSVREMAEKIWWSR